MDNVENPKLSVGKIIGKTLKYIAFVIMALVYGIFILRICTMGDPEEITKFTWNSAAINTYEAVPGQFTVYKINEESPGYVYIDMENGRFAINNIYYVQTDLETQEYQFQFLIRYNNSTLKAIKNEYNLEKNPEGEPFIYILRDTLGNVYKEYQFKTDKKNVYNYRRIIFDNIDMSQSPDLYLDIYYIDNVRLSSEAYETYPVYLSEFLSYEYDITENMYSDGGDKELRNSPPFLDKDGN